MHTPKEWHYPFMLPTLLLVKPRDWLGATLKFRPGGHKCEQDQSIPPLRGGSPLPTHFGEQTHFWLPWMLFCLIPWEEASGAFWACFMQRAFSVPSELTQRQGGVAACAQDIKKSPVSSSSPVCCIDAVTSWFPSHMRSAFLP